MKRNTEYSPQKQKYHTKLYNSVGTPHFVQIWQRLWIINATQQLNQHSAQSAPAFNLNFHSELKQSSEETLVDKRSHQVLCWLLC